MLRPKQPILASSIAESYIDKIIKRIDADNLVNVVAVEQDIGCLMTQRNIEDIDLKELKDTVLIPGRALVHDKMAHDILSRDGVDRSLLEVLKNFLWMGK